MSLINFMLLSFVGVMAVTIAIDFIGEGIISVYI